MATSRSREKKASNKIQRINYIKGELGRTRFISVDSIRRRFGVSAQTARSDLSLLEKQGVCRKAYGGAEAWDGVLPNVIEADALSKRTYRRIIGELRGELKGIFSNSTSILLAGGSLLYQELIRHAHEIFREDTTFYTTSIATARQASERYPTILLPGSLHTDKNGIGGEEVLQFLQFCVKRVNASIHIVTYIDSPTDRPMMEFGSKEDGRLAEKVIQEKLAGNILLVSLPNAFAPKRSFHPLPVRKEDFRLLIQVEYKDQEEQHRIVGLEKELRVITIARDGKKIIHLPTETA